MKELLMASEASSLQKVAVLTGLTMMIGGAEISEASAAVVTQSASFDLEVNTAFNSPATFSPSFSAFDSSLGTLTEIDVLLDSTLFMSGVFGASAEIQVNTSNATATGNFPTGPFDQSFVLSPGSTPPNITLTLATTCEQTSGPDCASWTSDSGEVGEQPGLTLEYIYTPTTAATPAPAALPLFATGLAALGFGAWRRRRKQSRA
jgi:hypothetical protein